MTEAALNEQCDDANFTLNDGCSNTCTYERLPIRAILEATPSSGATLGITDDAATTGIKEKENEVTYQLSLFNPNLQDVNVSLEQEIDSGFLPPVLPLQIIPALPTGVTVDLVDVAGSGKKVLQISGLVMPGRTSALYTFPVSVDPSLTIPAGHSGVTLSSSIRKVSAQVVGTTPIPLPDSSSNVLVHYVVQDIALGNGCGNKRIEGAEQCDDGNTNATDGCNACQLSAIAPICNAANLVLGGTCIDSTAQTPNLSGDGCNQYCQKESGICGNGIQETGEACDDGTVSDVDALGNRKRCSKTCTIQTAVCGDTKFEPALGEVCDTSAGGRFGTAQAPGSFNLVGGLADIVTALDTTKDQYVCDDACGAVKIQCGDGIVTSPFESCESCETLDEDGNQTAIRFIESGNCEPEESSNDTPLDGCSGNCQLEVGLCGNKIIEYHSTVPTSLQPYLEACDDGNSVSGDGCSADCRVQENLDFTVSMTSDPASGTTLRSRDLIEYQIEFTNHHAERTVKDALLTDRIPDSLEFVQMVDRAGATGSDLELPTDQNQRTLSVKFPALGIGESKTIRFLTRVKDTATARQIINNNVRGEGSMVIPPATEGASEVVLPLQSHQSNPSVHYIVPAPEVVCGNNRLEIGEQCDDGDRDSLDGCSSTCQLEALNTCGNGLLGAGEQCDDGDRIPKRQIKTPDTTDDVNNDCNEFCQNISPICGNGSIESGETCDDGNRINGDSCPNTCQIARCGDGILLTGSEECDDGNANNEDLCTSACKINGGSLPVSIITGTCNLTTATPTCVNTQLSVNKLPNGTLTDTTYSVYASCMDRAVSGESLSQREQRCKEAWAEARGYKVCDASAATPQCVLPELLPPEDPVCQSVPSSVSVTADLSKTILQEGSLYGPNHSVRAGDTVQYKIDFSNLNIASLPTGVALISATIKVYDHTIPMNSGALTDRLGIGGNFDCQNSADCWVESPTESGGVVFERKLSAAELQNGVSHLFFEYSMNSSLASDADTVGIDNVAFATVVYEYYDAGTRVTNGVVVGATGGSNTADPCTQNLTQFLNAAQSTNISAGSSLGKVAKVTLIRPFVKAQGADVSLSGDKISGDAGVITGSSATTGRLFTGTQLDTQTQDKIKKYSDFTADEYYAALEQNAGDASIFNNTSPNLSAIPSPIFTTTNDLTLSGTYDLKGISRTIIVEGANVNVNNDIILQNGYLAVIVRGGDILIDPLVEKLEGVYIAEPKGTAPNLIGGNITTSAESNRQLVVSGMLVGDLEGLLTQRTYIGEYQGGAFQLAPNVQLEYDLRILEQTPPGLEKALGSDWAQGK